MITCNKCGRQSSDSAKFCTDCGNQLQIQPIPQSRQITNPVTQQIPKSVQLPPQNYVPAPQSDNKKNRIIIIAVAVAAAVILLMVWFFAVAPALELADVAVNDASICLYNVKRLIEGNMIIG